MKCCEYLQRETQSVKMEAHIIVGRITSALVCQIRRQLPVDG